MPLTVEQLLTLDRIPVRGELSLKTITEFYMEYLAKRQFRLEIASPLQEIRIRFEPYNLPHLLGIHHIAGSGGSGQNGISQLRNEMITFETLMKANLGTFEDDELRMLCFPYVYQMIFGARLQPARPNDFTEASFVFRSPLSQKFCEFRIRKMHRNDPNSRFYVPLSFRVGKSDPFTQVKVRNVQELGYNDGYEVYQAKHHNTTTSQSKKRRKK